MGPTNIALVKLFQADQTLRAAQERLDHASRSVRQQERRIGDLGEKLKLAQAKLREVQVKNGEHELEIKTRDARIEKLRTQQQSAKNHKEYQAFLTEINAEKIDRTKVEDESLKTMQLIENAQAEVADLTTQMQAEQEKNTATRKELGAKLAELQADIDSLRPGRDQAAAAVPAKALETFERNCERFEGEAMAAIGKPDRRREEYVCTSCNMDLVADIYNKLHARDEMVPCPNCRRLLFIPDDLPPEMAINKPKERKEVIPREGRAIGAPTSRQLSAADINRSITTEESAGTEAGEAETGETETANQESASKEPASQEPVPPQS